MDIEHLITKYIEKIWKLILGVEYLEFEKGRHYVKSKCEIEHIVKKSKCKFSILKQYIRNNNLSLFKIKRQLI